MTTTYLITGANRGIGFELAKKISEKTNSRVVATTRSFERAKQLQDLNRPNLEIIELDVSAPLDDIKNDFAKSEFLKSGVDVVVHNAGVLKTDTGSSATEAPETYSYHFENNVLGSVKVYEAAFPYWIKENDKEIKKFVFISSIAGSIGELAIPTFSYGMSKAAVNFFAKHTSWEHAHSENPVLKNSSTIALHPGVVLTDMGIPIISALGLTDNAISPAESGAAIAKVVDNLSREDTGKFLSYDGSELVY